MKDKAYWNMSGDELTIEAFYDWPQPHGEIHKLRKVRLTDPQAHYFCAVDGQCYALQSLTNSTCLASVEDGLQLCGAESFYVIRKPKDQSDGAVTRWIKKWSKRTHGETTDLFDSSVRHNHAIA